ncbi:MAG: helix-turn-helix domain-containing protein [Clostridia bacterium]|nr:helix-turn-helix domain-containing protein [Clostridia bacterium]
MNDLKEGVEKAIHYIEDNICEELDIMEIAKRAYVSPFYFQKIFHVFCGCTVGEYIRNRRLTLAAQELSTCDVKVIDVALKYGYDSPDSFARAFWKFHGVNPSSAKQSGANLKCFAPIRLKLTLEGGTIMEYKIVEKATFTIVGKCRKFNADNSYEEIPKFWSEHYATGGGEIIQGVFGVCVDGDGKEFDYLIADLYFPCYDIPQGCETRTFEGGTWAVFPYHGECPEALQSVNTQIWREWLPNSVQYELAGNYNLEFYISETEGEIWVPVKKK